MQELLHDGRDVKITLHRRPAEADPWVIDDGDGRPVVTLAGGASLLWFTFPNRTYEVAAFHDTDDRWLGHYTNLIRPPALGDARWEITDRFLDVWQPAGGEPRLLDRPELDEALAAGWIDGEEAARVTATAETILRRARKGRWPPDPVERWTLGRVPELRLRRDAPGVYYANLVSNRIIAFGIYFLGAAALTTLGFAAATSDVVFRGPVRTAWLSTLLVEGTALLGVALAGRLPATRRVRPREALTERTLFWGTAVTAGAVLLVQEGALWRTLLSAVYGTLALFLAVFAVARSCMDRRVPVLALAGLVVCALALALLL